MLSSGGRTGGDRALSDESPSLGHPAGGALDPTSRGSRLLSRLSPLAGPPGPRGGPAARGESELAAEQSGAEAGRGWAFKGIAPQRLDSARGLGPEDARSIGGGVTRGDGNLGRSRHDGFGSAKGRDGSPSRPFEADLPTTLDGPL
ncbi:hypothetical protein KM043_000201 [Ampulex compressa]|nr:hypothetical protein KM043_000201 [Ampulex compressa]